MEKEIEKKEEKPIEEPAPGSEKKPEEKKPADSDIDYKAELEKTKKQLEKAEFKLTEKDKEERRKKKELEEGIEDDEPSDDDDDTPDVTEIVRKENEKFKLDLATDFIEDEIASLSDNPDEQDLIKFVYENRIVKTGFSKKSIREDVEAAWTLANRKKLLKRTSELKRAIDSERTRAKGGGTTGQPSDEDEPIKLSDIDRKILARHGLTEKDVK